MRLTSLYLVIVNAWCITAFVTENALALIGGLVYLLLTFACPSDWKA